VELRIADDLKQIPATTWDSLVGTDQPFLQHGFLEGLEAHGCLGAERGWHPAHLLLHEGETLVAAAPAYLKTNSIGEFVFDWGWADAYARMGRRYYPKLVVAVPYTPIVGPRVLVREADFAAEATRLLAHGAQQFCEEQGFSSAHWLFPPAESLASIQAAGGYVSRLGCQYHWMNAGYADFDDFLARLSADKRKKIKRERRRVRDAGIHLEVRHGSELRAADWDRIYQFYLNTYDRKWGIPGLTAEFFPALGERLGDAAVAVFAKEGEQTVAMALNLRDNVGLYGRYWGCQAQYHSLHFETCYYAGIEYAIEAGLERFEPGAQGEHKISRGFLPSRTYSAHWIKDADFREAVTDFCRREENAMEAQCEGLAAHSPFKASAP